MVSAEGVVVLVGVELDLDSRIAMISPHNSISLIILTLNSVQIKNRSFMRGSGFRSIEPYLLATFRERVGLAGSTACGAGIVSGITIGTAAGTAEVTGWYSPCLQVSSASR